MALSDRLMAQIQKSEGCWLWRGAVDVYGYGVTSIMKDGKQKALKAHRAVYQMLRGDLSPNFDLHHTCENPPCVNPDHLKTLSRSEHKKTPHSTWGKSQFCKYGHPMSGSNLYVWKGTNCCRACNARYTRLRRGVAPEGNPRYPITCWRCGNTWEALLPDPKHCANRLCKTRNPSRTKPCPPKGL